MSEPGAARSTQPSPKLENWESSSRRVVEATVTTFSRGEEAGKIEKTLLFVLELPAAATKITPASRA